MKDLLKKLKSLIAKGFATKAEKEAVKKELEALDAEEQEVLGDKVEEVEKLPEEERDEETEKMLKSLMDKNKSEITDELKSEIKSFMREQKELMEKKAGAYAPELANERKMANTKMKAICLALVSKDDSLVKEMTTDATGTPYAGYVVDSELSAEIRHLTTQYGVARREMTVVPLVKNSYKANTLVTDVSTFWVDEGDNIDSTQIVLGQDSLELKKLGAIVALTRELIEDGEIDLFGFIASRIAEGFAKAEDEAFFTGAGSEDSSNGGFTGVLNDTSVNSYAMTSSSIEDLTTEDLLGLIDKTPSSVLGSSKFYMHRTIMSIIRKLRTDAVSAGDGKGDFIYQAPSVSGPSTIWGYPVILSEVFPTVSDDAEDTPFIIFGDLRKACLFGYKGGISADMFDAGTIKNVAGNADINLITSDRKAMRWIERVGFITLLPKAVSVLKTGEVSE